MWIKRKKDCRGSDISGIKVTRKEKISMNHDVNTALLLNQLMFAGDAITPDIDAAIKNMAGQLGADKTESIAKEWKIISYVSHTLSIVFPEEKRWMDIHKQYLKRNELLLEVLEKVFADTEKEGITSLCVTENFGSILRGHACLGCFQSGDIDMTADRSEQKKIEAVFQKYGFILKSDTVQVTKYKNTGLIPGGFSFQITWVAVARSYLNQKAPTKRLAESRIAATAIEGKHIKVLNPTEQLYFCSYHISAGHYYTLTPGIRLYADIDRLLRGNQKIEWDKVFDWSREDNVGLRVVLPIYLSHKFLKTPVPNSVIQFIEENPHAVHFAKKLTNPSDMGFGCNSGTLHRLYVDLASNGTSMTKALVEKIKGN